MQAITLEVILRAVFGVEDPSARRAVGAPLRRMLDTVASRRRVLSLALTRGRTGPRSPWARVRRAARGAADAAAPRGDRGAARRTDGAERDDILSLLLAARDEDGSALTDAELRDELMTLLVAGHETTATALAWTLERLVRHPARAAACVEAEQRAGGDELLEPTIKETLRLRPVVPGGRAASCRRR